MKKKILISGNEAIGKGAIDAGCVFYAGYPITPQNELTAYMAEEMPKLGRIFIQSESELAAINMVYGAAACGARCMTSSSSPGISLKQEGLSYIAGSQVPAVIINVMRAGPGLGNIWPAQSDYFQAVKGGGHGDYRIIVLAPASIQESYDLTISAFDLADQYRIAVMILSDGMLGQMMEALEYDCVKDERILVEKPWALTGAKNRSPNVVHSLFIKYGDVEKNNLELQAKYRSIEKHLERYELLYADDAQALIVAYGSMSRVAESAVKQLRKEGIKVGLFRPVTLWPFPQKALQKLSKRIKKFFVVEMSYGQMVEDVRLVLCGSADVGFYGRSGGGVPSEDQVKSHFLKFARLKKKVRKNGKKS